jgi:predicted nucleotidyltransferase
VAIFTADQRERLRAELVTAARNDSNLCGAAHTGSAASGRLDRWSDIDLALCLRRDASYEQVVSAWTERLYNDHAAVAHVDVMRGTTLFRVFLLRDTLQVDIAFWRQEDFAAYGPNFQPIFVREGAEAPQRDTPAANPLALAGMAWLYGLHVRSSIARGRLLQAEYMLSGMRNHVFELACLGCGVVAQQGRGLDDLLATEREKAASCIPCSLEPSELKRAFQRTMQMFLDELRLFDADLETKLSGPLRDLLL